MPIRAELRVTARGLKLLGKLSAGPTRARAVALRDWSSSVWTTLDEIQADVMAGNRPLPTLPELLAELPQPA